MNDRRQFLIGQNSRAGVLQAVMEAPLGYVVDIRPETRSDAQNRLLWPLLSDISEQVIWHERQLPPAEWKNGLMMALQNAEFIPGINPRTVWPLGLSTSVLTKSRFSELIELTYAFGADNNVRFRTDN